MRALAALIVVPFALAGAACTESSASHAPGAEASAEAASGTAVTVYKSPSCGCCREWVTHLEENGFTVASVDRDDMAAVKAEQGVPTAVASCHTAVVDGYVVEGHVPADVIRRLLSERPDVKGIAVPGMPVGSPGMEMGSRKDPYEVFTFDESGPREIYEVR